MSNISRRKFLKISAVSLTLPFSTNLLANNTEKISWEGYALGAQGNMTLFHKSPTYANKILNICIQEIHRLEKIFSLYDTTSSISLLNKNGSLQNPPEELVEVLEFSHEISKKTNGAFDVTVQPLWSVHNKFFKDENNQNIKKLQKEINKNISLVSYKNISIDKKIIFFKQKDMQITLNGIAQGYITDKITNILRQNGFTNVLVDLGEFNSIGGYDNTRDWNIATPYLKDISYISLNNMAVASSGGYGTKFNENYHHLFDTQTGTSANHISSVTIKAPNAMLADALSTAVYVMPLQESKKLKHFFPNIEIYIS